MLLKPDAVRSLKKDLLPLALVITPNIPEAEVLAGMRIMTDGDMDFAAGILMDLGRDMCSSRADTGQGLPLTHSMEEKPC